MAKLTIIDLWEGTEVVIEAEQRTEEKQMIELKDTIELMTSEDYKDRFKAEYYQAKIRRDKLHTMLMKAYAGKLEFEPSCPLDYLAQQKVHMEQYIDTLIVRAYIEGIEL